MKSGSMGPPVPPVHLNSLMLFAGFLGSGISKEDQPAQVTVIVVLVQTCKLPETQMATWKEKSGSSNLMSGCFAFDWSNVHFLQMEKQF